MFVVRSLKLHPPRPLLPVGRREKEKVDRFDAMALCVPELNPKLREQFAGILRQIAHDEREACAKIAEEQAQVFLSPEYATDQPISSIGERFACKQIAAAIRSRI